VLRHEAFAAEETVVLYLSITSNLKRLQRIAGLTLTGMLQLLFKEIGESKIGIINPKKI